MQPEFNRPEFLEGNSAEEIHERMMNNLPDDIDDMPGGFPYDMTMPAALEKDEIINFHIVRALMIAFPEYAWDEWLDLHGRQVHLTRHEAEPAFGYVKSQLQKEPRFYPGRYSVRRQPKPARRLSMPPQRMRLLETKDQCLYRYQRLKQAQVLT